MSCTYSTLVGALLLKATLMKAAFTRTQPELSVLQKGCVLPAGGLRTEDCLKSSTIEIAGEV